MAEHEAPSFNLTPVCLCCVVGEVTRWVDWCCMCFPSSFLDWTLKGDQNCADLKNEGDTVGVFSPPSDHWNRALCPTTPLEKAACQGTTLFTDLQQIRDTFQDVSAGPASGKFGHLEPMWYVIAPSALIYPGKHGRATGPRPKTSWSLEDLYLFLTCWNATTITLWLCTSGQ